MLLERLLALAAGLALALCVGVGLLLLAFGANRSMVDVANAFTAGVDRTPGALIAAPGEEKGDKGDKGSARERIETLIAQTPDYAPFFARMREAFTAEYEATLDEFSKTLAETDKEQTPDYYLSEAMRRLRLARGAAAAKADAPPIAAVFERQLDVLRAAAQQDKHMCVAFLYGATNADFQRFAATKRALVGMMAITGLEAIVSGESKPIQRTPPTDADFDMLEKALAGRGLGQAEIDALLDGKMPDPPLEDARMCDAGQTYFEVLKTLPEPARTKVYGLALELMAKS